MRKFTTLLSIIMLFLGCSKTQGIEAETQNQLKIQVSQSDGEHQGHFDICEAVFRYQFKHNASAVQQNARAYFITIFSRDPSDEFLDRFTGNTPPVRKGSDFEIGKGLAFNISSINRINKNTVQVSGGYYETSLSSSGNIYTVVRRNGHWVVEDDETLWISSGDYRPTYHSIAITPVMISSIAQ